jgi:hypothetical protein
MTDAQWQEPEVPHPTGVGPFRFFRPIQQEVDRKKTGSRDHCCNALFDKALAHKRGSKQQVNRKETGSLPSEPENLQPEGKPEAFGLSSVGFTWSHASCLSSQSSVSPPRARNGVRTCEPAFERASPAASGRTIHPCISVQRCRSEVEP